jgi:hypothetical protein
MKPTKNAIEQHLLNNRGHYINPFAVETTLDEYGVFNMDARWPEPFADPDYNLEISIDDTTVQAFSKLSGIKTVEQLLFVSPHMLIELFQMGLAYVVCMIDTREGFYYELFFRKENGKLFMYDEEEDIRQLVKLPLNTAEDFFEYTRNYVSKL